MFDFFSLLSGTQPAAPIEDRTTPTLSLDQLQQQQLVAQMQKMLAASQLPDTTGKAVELAGKGDPWDLIQMFTPQMTLDPRTRENPILGRTMDPSVQGFSRMLYQQQPKAQDSMYRPSPMLPKPGGWEVLDPNKLPADVDTPQKKAFGLTTEQIAALAGLMPKYQEPQLFAPQLGRPSQVNVNAFTLPKQISQRVTLADILRGGR